VFGDPASDAYLVKFSWTDIVWHVMVTGAAAPVDPGLADYWAERRRKVKPPLDNYTLRLLARQDARCPLCGDHLLTAEQPPQSPNDWELWWQQVTRQGIAADYLVHHASPAHRTMIQPASCTPAADGGFAPAGARNQHSQPARPCGLLEPYAARVARTGSGGIGGATRRSYPAEHWALRTEAVINSPDDLRCRVAWPTWTSCSPKPVTSTAACSIVNVSGRVVSLRAQPLRGSRSPRSPPRGRRAPALRFGDPRVMALLGALCIALNTVTGFTNRSLRAQVSGLLGTAYTGDQMSYDLARLRVNGLIRRLPHTNTYVLTDDGQRVAIFYTKVHARLLWPLLAATSYRRHQHSERRCAPSILT
jgi:hypothetical protein